jgi:hypothetical protein
MERTLLLVLALGVALAAAQPVYQLHVGGTFSSAGGIVAGANSATWNGAAWAALGSPNSYIGAAAFVGGQLYVGGLTAVTTIGGVTAKVASFNGASWSVVASTTTNEITHLGSYGSSVVVGGSFTTIAGVSYARVALFNGTFSSMASGVNINYVFASVANGTTLYVGGSFLSASSVANTRLIAAWDGAAWSAVGTGIQTGTLVLAVCMYHNDLIAGGAFTSVSGSTINNFARWDGATWSVPTGVGSGPAGTVYALVQYASDLIVSGTFTAVNSVSTNRIFSWDGASFSSLGSGMNGNVLQVATHSGILFAAGSFTTAGGVSATNIAQWDGATWSALGAGIAVTSTTNVMSLTPFWTACEPGSYGPSCAACSVECINGQCNDGFFGNGECRCEGGWVGPTCENRTHYASTKVFPSVASSADDYFGSSVAVFKNTVAAGAPQGPGANGKVYLFHCPPPIPPGACTEQLVVTAPDGASGDQFGYSVALFNERLLVGAPSRNSSRGAVYAYDCSFLVPYSCGTPTVLTRVAANGVVNARFGASVDMFEDTAIVSEPVWGAAGGVHFAVCTGDAASTCAVRTYMTSTDTASGWGKSIGMCGRGAVYSGNWNVSGSTALVRHFTCSSTAPYTCTARVSVSGAGTGGNTLGFGESVAVGCARPPGTWKFGSEGSWGSYVAVSNPTTAAGGSLWSWICSSAGTCTARNASVVSSNTVARFGDSMAWGNNLLVASSGASPGALSFNYATSTPLISEQLFLSNTQTDYDDGYRFDGNGDTRRLAVDRAYANTVVRGHPNVTVGGVANAGALVLHTCDTTINSNVTCVCETGWAGWLCDSCAAGFTGANCDACSSGYFGPLCKLCACYGAACFDGIGGNGSCVSADASHFADVRLQPVESIAGENFGFATAIFKHVLAVGAPGTGNGRVVLFYCPQPVPMRLCEQRLVVTAPDGAAGDGFGMSVALFFARLVVGAPNAASATGAAYAYDCVFPVVGAWACTYATKFTRNNTLAAAVAGSQFGINVEAWTNQLVIGEFGSTGGVHFYTGATVSPTASLSTTWVYRGLLTSSCLSCVFPASMILVGNNIYASSTLAGINSLVMRYDARVPTAITTINLPYSTGVGGFSGDHGSTLATYSSFYYAVTTDAAINSVFYLSSNPNLGNGGHVWWIWCLIGTNACLSGSPSTPYQPPTPVTSFGDGAAGGAKYTAVMASAPDAMYVYYAPTSAGMVQRLYVKTDTSGNWTWSGNGYGRRMSSDTLLGRLIVRGYPYAPGRANETHAGGVALSFCDGALEPATSLYCECAMGWAGAACDTCASGFTGAACDACSSGFWGRRCQACKCNGGTCDDGIGGTGACTTTPTRFASTQLLSPTPEADAFFGQSVASWGSVLAVGAPQDGAAPGSVHLYECTFPIPPGSCVWMATVTADDGANGDAFGYSVALASATRLIVGAPFAQGRQGAAYIYDCVTSGTWSCTLGIKQTRNATLSAASTNAWFGMSVDAWDTSVIVSEPATAGINAGGIHWFFCRTSAASSCTYAGLLGTATCISCEFPRSIGIGGLQIFGGRADGLGQGSMVNSWNCDASTVVCTARNAFASTTSYGGNVADFAEQLAVSPSVAPGTLSTPYVAIANPSHGDGFVWVASCILGNSGCAARHTRVQPSTPVSRYGDGMAWGQNFLAVMSDDAVHINYVTQTVFAERQYIRFDTSNNQTWPGNGYTRRMVTDRAGTKAIFHGHPNTTVGGLYNAGSVLINYCDASGETATPVACTCEVGWAGTTCSACAASYYGASCAPCSVCDAHGACVEGLAGYCTCEEGWTGSDCAACDTGFFGPNCTACACVRGSCADGVSNNGTCTCPSNWAGATCALCAAGHFGESCTACPGCGAHGTCNQGLAGNGSCSCAAGWAGELCDVCAGGRYGPSCLACSCGVHGTCNATLDGDGACACDAGWSGATCAQCSSGFFGPSCDACTCVNGACNEGIAGSGACACDAGWAGASCDECASGHYGATCDPCLCGEHGACSEGLAGDGSCSCDAGWSGATCEDCEAGFYGEHCTACACTPYGACADGRLADGSCACDLGWAGAICDQCEAGYFGETCSPCACGVHAIDCEDGYSGSGECECDYGWAGATCEECNVGFFGPDCLPCDCMNGYCADTLDGDGSCACYDNWVGDLCDECSAGFFGPTCAECQCYVSPCDDGASGDGHCYCDTGFTGASCDQCEPGRFGPTCAPCECEHGTTCFGGIGDEGGQCTCTDGFDGFYCEFCSVGYYGDSCDACDCVYGTCDEGHDGTGACACAGAHTGARCDACEPGTYGSGCEDCNCGAHGVCDEGIDGSGGCTCDAGFAGTYCDECAPGYFGAGCDACPACENGGECQESALGSGLCTCTDNYVGTLCAECASGFFGAGCQLCMCGQHGTCDEGIEGTGACACDVGFAGATCTECDVWRFGATCEPCTCGNRSFCDASSGACTCHEGWGSAPACDECASGYFGETCALCQCSVHGICSETLYGDGSCDCAPGWTGDTCAQCLSGYFGENCTECACAHGTCDDLVGGSGNCSCSLGWAGATCSVCAAGYGGASCTLIPTTASPTTAAPTTASPTTASPTTTAPTTAAPTTASPTTPSNGTTAQKKIPLMSNTTEVLLRESAELAAGVAGIVYTAAAAVVLIIPLLLVL